MCSVHTGEILSAGEMSKITEQVQLDFLLVSLY